MTTKRLKTDNEFPDLLPRGTVVDCGSLHRHAYALYWGNAGKRWEGQAHWLKNQERRFLCRYASAIVPAGRWDHVEGLLYRWVSITPEEVSLG